MMKKVFSSNSQLAHEFATNGMNTEREGRASNIFFEHGKLYSYGRHFCIARYIDNDTLLFTTRGYSNSTAKHINITRQALSHKNLIFCPHPNDTEDSFEVWRISVEVLITKLSKATKPAKYLNELTSISQQLETYCEALQISAPSELLDLLKITTKEESREIIRKAEAERKAKEAEAQRVRNEKSKRQIKEFLLGQLPRVDIRGKFDFLRYSQGLVVTSQGLEIPKEAALKLWECIKAGKLETGVKFLDYTVGDVGKFISIGCHTFNRAYLVKFGKQLVNN
jgi:hypothetical protein